MDGAEAQNTVWHLLPNCYARSVSTIELKSSDQNTVASTPCPWAAQSLWRSGKELSLVVQIYLEDSRDTCGKEGLVGRGRGHRCAVSTREAAECRELERRCARINGHICGKSTVTV